MSCPLDTTAQEQTLDWCTEARSHQALNPVVMGSLLLRETVNAAFHLVGQILYLTVRSCAVRTIRKMFLRSEKFMWMPLSSWKTNLGHRRGFWYRWCHAMLKHGSKSVKNIFKRHLDYVEKIYSYIDLYIDPEIYSSASLNIMFGHPAIIR